MVKYSILKIIYGLSYVIYSFSKYFSSKNRIPIICYHRTSPNKNNLNKYWNVSPDDFKMQMKYLNNSGFTTIYTHEIPNILKKETWTDKYICITFDDGYNDNYDYAYQIIKEFNFKANFYISTNYIDNNVPYHFLIQENMTDFSSIIPIKKKQLIEMSKNRISIQSHSHIHKNQSNMTKEEIKNDIKKSLVCLNEIIPKDNTAISYVAPFGVHGLNAGKVKKALKELNIKLAFLGKWGSVKPNSELINMNRVSIYGRDNINEFKLKVEGAYDWVGILYEFYKNNIRRS